MLYDLDQTLRQLLIQQGGLDPAEVDISFDIPTRDWSTPVTRPTINLYLYDIRENRELRENYWDEEGRSNGRVILKRRPIRMDLSYMVTCWTSQTEDQHRLLWQVLWTLFKYSPLPDAVLQGVLKDLRERDAMRRVLTEVAQPDGILKNVSDFWGALENQLRPAVSLTAILDLDLNAVKEPAVVFARGIRVGEADFRTDDHQRRIPLFTLKADVREEATLHYGGRVLDPQGQPVGGADVRLIHRASSAQVGPSVETDAEGRFVFRQAPAGDYTLTVEKDGDVRNVELTLTVPERGQTPPRLVTSQSDGTAGLIIEGEARMP